MKRKRILQLIAIGTLLLGIIFIPVSCAKSNVYNGLHAYTIDALKKEDRDNKKPKIAIAFGGGGIRGFMHLGVIKAFEEAGIKVDIVTGSSAGSIAATLYATGKPYHELEQIILNLKKDDIADFVLSTKGFINGQSIARWVNRVTGSPDISSLPFELGITVTELNSERSLLLREGNVGQAVQASSSIPGAFIPVKTNGKTFVDGGMLSLVPVRFAKALGADYVIGVDIYCGNKPVYKDSTMGVLYTSFRIQNCALGMIEAKESDILIAPGYEPPTLSSFETKKESIDAGYKAAKAMMPKIKKGIERLKHPAEKL